MSSLGRGRGRGRGSAREGDDAPKPGNVSPTEEIAPKTTGAAIDINQISTLVQTLSLEADDISKDMVSNAVVKYADTASRIEEILRVLYIKILQDWRYAKHMAFICARLVRLPKLGVAFRTSLVRRIQSDFNNRETDREEKPRTFLGCMAFLCQVLHQLRNADGAPFRPLVTPVYKGLQMLTDGGATDKEMEVAITQLLDIGHLLQKENDEEMKKLMETLREKILDAKASRENRVMMLALLEKNAGGWAAPVTDNTASKNGSPKHAPFVRDDSGSSASGGGGAAANTTGDAKKESPKHASPKRVSFNDVTQVTTISSSANNTRPTYTTAPVTDDFPDDFGGVWENPPSHATGNTGGETGSGWGDPVSDDAETGNTRTFSYNWSSPPPTPEKNDNDAGQWQYPTGNWDK